MNRILALVRRIPPIAARTHITLQVLLTIFQGINALAPILPKAQPAVECGITILQALIAFRAHYSNPDGTHFIGQ